MKLNSLKFVHCNIDSGNELPRSLRLGPNLWINMDSTILISYLLLLFTSLKFSSLMGWPESRASWRILLLGDMLNDCQCDKRHLYVEKFYIWVVFASLLCRKMSTDHIDIYK